MLGDITCDSDGKVDQFIDRRDVRRTLPLHALNGSPYYLGVFLVGAYQEILGDLHNLCGDTHYEGSGRLLQFFEDGLHGYTYLEERKT